MTACASCGTENPDGFRFCPGCGSPLTAPPPTLPEERKVVSALFCDLVGFTATSEGADPEDVDRMLTAYFTMARGLIEAHGGVVEKFIGDAVLGVFGVPAAHEDDAERAVRTALRICEDAAGLESLAGQPLRLRVGINTGEVLVRLGVVPGSGERFLAGNTINTASRIQSVAPEMGVAVGLATFEATKPVFEYEELPPASLKGKAEPVRVFHAKASRARLGVDLTRTHGGAYVGREIDLALLRGLFDKSVAASSVQLVTVVGEPGIGKSRIVAELLAHAQSRAPGLTWRQGRCLPYGDGVTFWALGEILKAHAGILETDDPAIAGTKIDDAVPTGPDRDWLRQRLRPLVGVDASSGAEREELFAAWRMFLETVAEAHPTVLVFEDIHWADDAMLAFLEHLADRAEGVPLLLVATTRPELFERHATFGAALPNANRINLAPLSDAETAQLITGLLGAVVPPELQGPILERAEGNPLYAEEFVRLLTDRDLLVETDGAVTLRPGAALPLPESIGALIAARLDTLPPERKAMLADAAVVGKVFWAGAVAVMGDRDPAAVADAMRELARKELVRPARRSSMAGETEYAFWHVLTRDVAYSQLPRASRAARHVAAAQWLEAKAGERAEDLAEVLAHHWATALELARAAGQAERATSLEPKARQYLTLAGEKAMGLDAPAAFASFERALALAPDGPDRAAALARFGEAALHAGHMAAAAAALEEAIASFRAGGDLEAAARAMGTLGSVLYDMGDGRWVTLPAEAVGLLEGIPPGPALVGALSELSRVTFYAGTGPAAALPHAERALALAAELGLPRPARALAFRGYERVALGDVGGLDDMREAIALATEAGQGREVVIASVNVAGVILMFDGPRASQEALRATLDFARARGLDGMAVASSQVQILFECGEFDEALSVAAAITSRPENNRTAILLNARAFEVLIRTLRGQADRTVDGLGWLEATARATGSPMYLFFGLRAAALAWLALGETDAAAALLRELLEKRHEDDQADPPLVRAALAVGDYDLAEAFGTGSPPTSPYAEHCAVASDALLAEARDDLEAAAAAYADAADRWERFGVVPEEAFALLGQGRCLLALRRPAEAASVLHHARGIFERLGAAPALAETDALLATVG